MNTNTLRVDDLHVSFMNAGSEARAVRGVSFCVGAKRTLGIVGESGCGKSVTAQTILRLLPSPPAKIKSGKILFDNMNLLEVNEKTINKIRGQRISMVFQDPMTSLNPVFTCGSQVAETLILHKGMDKKNAESVCVKTFEEVGINDPRRAYKSYPHELSGGMRQRVMIAMALVCRPTLLIADEPTTALDVTVQAKILELLQTLQNTKDMSMILITHNLGIAAMMAHDVIVMYAGVVVESAPSKILFETPRHPYTNCLLQTIPSVEKRNARLTVIPGSVPTPLEIPAGCPFHPRCPQAFDRCKTDEPQLRVVNNVNNVNNNSGISDVNNHFVRCHLYE